MNEERKVERGIKRAEYESGIGQTVVKREQRGSNATSNEPTEEVEGKRRRTSPCQREDNGEKRGNFLGGGGAYAEDRRGW